LSTPLQRLYFSLLVNRTQSPPECGKEDLLEASLFILERLEEQATELVISYHQTEKQSADDILNVKILSITATSDDGLQMVEAFDDDVIREWIENLDDSVTFNLRKGKFTTRLGTLRNYDPYTRQLSLRLDYQGNIPSQGRIECSNVAMLASIERQKQAVERFLSNETVNTNLGDLLLQPHLNRLGERRPRSLIQDLEPAVEMQSLVERALAAQDFFLIQGSSTVSCMRKEEALILECDGTKVPERSASCKAYTYTRS
jgi:hypothetical protein